MGPDLELVVLDMTVEDQMERVRTRARESEQAVEILKVRFYMNFKFWLAGRSKIAMLSLLHAAIPNYCFQQSCSWPGLHEAVQACRTWRTSDQRDPSHQRDESALCDEHDY